MRQYGRLSLVEREEISRSLAAGISYQNIGKRLERYCSTIVREIKRNSSDKASYRAVDAQQKAQAESKKHGNERKLVTNKRLEKIVVKYLKKHWSPEQIVKRLEILYPNDMEMRISHETIYAYIYVHPRKHLKRALLKYLRRKHKFRRIKNKERQKSCPIQDYVSIEERPQLIEGRKIAGHWEGDLIMGAVNASAIGTLVERKTRLTILVKLNNKNSETVCNEFAKKFRRLPKSVRKSLTYDQGQEMANHAEFAKETKIKVYFAHPHSPWERGTSENTNSLVREFFPRGTNFSKVSSSRLKRVENLLNDRPRKVLNFYTPREVFTKTVAIGT